MSKKIIILTYSIIYDVTLYDLVIQVFKVVCNHLITPEITIKPMVSSNKAFCWACMNTTEDNPDPQKEFLAVRFKNEESADKFKKVFDDCLLKLSA